MNTTLVLGALLLCAPLLATEKRSQRPIITAHSATSTALENPLLRIGASRDDVIHWLGEPSDTLSPDIWIYRNYRTNQPGLNACGFDTLLLTFANSRVSTMRIVDGRAVDALVIRLRLNSPLRYHAQ